MYCSIDSMIIHQLWPLTTAGITSVVITRVHYELHLFHSPLPASPTTTQLPRTLQSAQPGVRYGWDIIVGALDGLTN